MGRQIKGLLYFFMADIRFSFMIFWSILLGFLIVGVVAALLLLEVDGSGMNFGVSFAVYIYCSILGFLTVRESVPFSLKMGATRKKLFVSLALFFLGISVLQSVIANTLHTVVLWITEGLSITTFGFIHLSQLLTDTWITRVIIDATVLFFLLSVMYLLGLIFYRTGFAGGGSAIGLVVITLLIGIAQGWLVDFFVNIYNSIDITLFYQVFLIGVLLYGMSWIFVRKITTVKVK